MVAMQGVSSTQFLKVQLGHDVTALMCTPMEFLKHKSGDRTKAMGCQFVKWGPTVKQNCSELDFTADVFGCDRC